MATNKEIINSVEEKGDINFPYILGLSKNKKQFKDVLKHFKVSNSDINRFLSDAELYEPKLRK